MGIAPECLVESKTRARTKVVEVFCCSIFDDISADAFMTSVARVSEFDGT